MVYPNIPYSETPVISIIIQCHNDIENLPNSVKSIFNQGINDFEVIIIDNNSSDNTWEWLIEQTKEEQRLRIFKLPDTDIKYSRKFAIQQCKGNYIAFLNPNDEWRPMKLQNQYNYLEKNKNVIMCFSNYAYISTQDNISITHLDLFPYSGFYKKDMSDYYILDNSEKTSLSDNSINTSTVLVRKTALLIAIKTVNKIKTNKDCDLWCRLSKLGDIAFTKKTGAQYMVKNNIKSTHTYYKLLKLKRIINAYTTSTKHSNHLIFIKHTALFNTGNSKYRIKTETLFSTLTHQLKA